MKIPYKRMQKPTMTLLRDMIGCIHFTLHSAVLLRSGRCHFVDACDAYGCASFHQLDNGLAVDELATNTKTLASFMITHWEGNAFLLDDGGDGVLWIPSFRFPPRSFIYKVKYLVPPSHSIGKCEKEKRHISSHLPLRHLL